MTKFASLKKYPHKNCHREKNLELNDLGFLCYLAKACRLLRVYIDPFFNLYITLP